MNDLTKAGMWGAVGGSCVASAVLTAVALMGRMGDTGSNHVGYWEPAVLGLGFMYGAPMGATMLLLLRIAFRRLDFRGFMNAIIWAGAIATLAGVFGGVRGPGMAFVSCVSCFVVLAPFLGARSTDKRKTEEHSGS